MNRTADLFDFHTILVILTVAFFVLTIVFGISLVTAGEITVSDYLSANALAIVNAIMGLLYVGYLAFWKGRVYLRYENTSPHDFAKYAAIGLFLHAVFYFFGPSLASMIRSVYLYTLGLGYSLVGITENAFFIGVVADLVAERVRRYRELIASLVAGLTAVIYHVAVYGYYPFALLTVFTMFAYWAYASLKMRSTLYADVHHMVGNIVGFIRLSVVVA